MKVLMLGTKARGGMFSVAENYLNSNLASKYHIKFIPTHIEANFIFQASYFLFSILKSLVYLANPDYRILHIHISKGGSIIRKGIFAFMGKLFNKKIIIQTHGGEFFELFNKKNNFMRKCIMRILNLADIAIVLSEKRKEEYSKLINKDKIRVIPNFVNIPQIKHKKQRDNMIRVISLGRLGRVKGTRDLIKAAEKIRIKGVIFEILGDGEVEECRAIVNELGLQDKIKIPGWIQGKEKERVFQSADIFVLPSHYEDLPMAILEAMSHGLPVISTRVGGIPELVYSGFNGFLVEPGNVDDLARKLIRLIKNKNLRERMGRNSLSFVKKNFERSVVEKKISCLYLELNWQGIK